MALTVSESIDVIRVIEWITGMKNPMGESVSRNDALLAAMRLNDKAHQRLGAGPSNEEIAAKWPAVLPAPKRRDR